MKIFLISINILKFITNNEVVNQSKQTRNQPKQNLIQPNIVYDQSNNEKIQFLPNHSAKRLNDQHQSQPLAKRQKQQFIFSQNQNIENNHKQIQLKSNTNIFDISSAPKKTNERKGLKRYLPMNSKHADNNIVEEIFEEFSVTSHNP